MKSLLSIVVVASASMLAGPAFAADLGLRFIGQQIVPTGTQALGTTVGGLSGIDYDAASNHYLAISDDRSQINPARYYTLDLALTSAAFTGVSFTGTQALKRPDGSTYPALGVDPESIRSIGNGQIIYSSEGDASAGLIPFVRQASLDGSFVRDMTVPAYYNPAPGYGIRNNLAFESLTLSNDGGSIITGLENALTQDGTASTGTTGSPSRVLTFDRATGLPTAEYVYQVDPLAVAPTGSNFGVNGLVELLGLGGSHYLAVERSYTLGAPGTGYSIKLYDADFAGATNVLGDPSLLDDSYTPIAKTLLFDLGALGIALDNIEGVTFGPMLDNGDRSLILVSDNNFSASQFTQFIAFDVGSVPEPASWSLLIAGFGLVGGALRRRRSPANA